jgi:hypothetical protein
MVFLLAIVTVVLMFGAHYAGWAMAANKDIGPTSGMLVVSIFMLISSIVVEVMR